MPQRTNKVSEYCTSETSLLFGKGSSLRIWHKPTPLEFPERIRIKKRSLNICKITRNWVMANTNLLDYLDIFLKAPKLKRCLMKSTILCCGKKKSEGKNYLSKHHSGVCSQEWFLPGLWCVPLISSSAAKISLELCVQSGALGFKLIEEPGQRN